MVDLLALERKRLTESCSGKPWNISIQHTDTCMFNLQYKPSTRPVESGHIDT